jgi:hypothetical protein
MEGWFISSISRPYSLFRVIEMHQEGWAVAANDRLLDNETGMHSCMIPCCGEVISVALTLL